MSESTLEKILGSRQKRIAARRRHYETIFIVSPTLSESVFNEILEKNANLVGSSEGTLLRQDNWGKLKMAYEIEKHQQGHYVYFRYIGSSDTVRALERSLKLDSNVVRFGTVKLSEDLSSQQIHQLMQKAPNEPSTPPSSKADEELEFAQAGRY